MFGWLLRSGLVTHGMVGRWHARRNYPRQDHAIAIPTYREARLREAAGDPIDRIGRIVPSGQQLVAPHTANLIAQSEQRQQAVARRTLPALAALRPSLNNADRRRGRLEHDCSRVTRKIEALDKPKHGRDLPTWAYWLCAILFFAIEIPVTIGALSPLQIPEQSEPAVAIFISILNFFAAKTTARVVRQQVWRSGDHGGWIIGLVLNLALVAMLIGLSVLRADAVAANVAAEAGQQMTISGTLAPVVTQPSTAPATNAPSTLSYAFFFFVQLAGYLSILLLSFFQVDPDATREQLTKEADELHAGIETQWQAREQDAARHNQLLASALLEVEEIRDDCRERCYQYQEGNVLWRTEDIPAFFGTAISDDVFKPLFLGRMVEEHPAQAAAGSSGAESTDRDNTPAASAVSRSGGADRTDNVKEIIPQTED